MAFDVGLFQIQAQGADVALSGFEIGVAQHLLHRYDVCAVLDQVAGKGMAEGVGRDLLFDACGLGMGADHDRDHLIADRVAVAVHDKRPALPVLFGAVRPHPGDVLP